MLKNVIYYFSGTGNSLAIAKHIGKYLKETEIIHISALNNSIEIDNSYERVGFVFPVYELYMPNVMKEILNNLKFQSNQYVFGVVSFAGSRGMALQQLREIVDKNGGKLTAEFKIRMPGNNIVEYGGFPDFFCEFLYQGESKKILKIISIIDKKERTAIIGANILAKLFNKNSLKRLEILKSRDNKFRVNNNCTHCKICKRICPVGNITMLNEIPTWNNNCEQCMACIQWCPVRAIEYSNKNNNKRRYSHPEIKVEDLMLNKVKGEVYEGKREWVVGVKF